MSPKKSQPRWWQLYATLPLLVGVLWLEMQMPLTETEHVIAQVVIVLLIYALVHLWLRANRGALLDVDQEDGEWRMRVYEVPPAQPMYVHEQEKPSRERPMLRYPAGGLKGVLGDTFEWEMPEEEPALLHEDAGVSGKE